MEADFASILRIDFTVKERDLPKFEELVTPTSATPLIERIDRILFGKKGTFAESIKAGGRGTGAWKPLSYDYFEWKKKMKASGFPVYPYETPPNKVISTDIWIRTGKMLQFTQTVGTAGFKRVKMYPENILKGKPFYEVYVDDKSIPYWEYPNASRKLFEFTPEDQDAAQAVFTEWMQGLFVEAIRRARLAA